jgi:NAD(P)-dependent dehydrogenase (short-subunit alcohol dehydrogenase family)
MMRLSEDKGGRLDLSHTAMNRQGKPEEVADVISWLLSDASKFVPRTVQAVDGGWLCQRGPTMTLSNTMNDQT